MVRALGGSAALTLLAVGGCNLISGVDDFRFGEGGGATTTNTTSTGGGGGEGGAGGCAYDCLGGECVDGKCAPVVFAGDEPEPFDIVLSQTDVYWSNLRSNTPIKRCPLAGCPDPGEGGGGGGTPDDAFQFTSGASPYALAWSEDDGKLYFTRRAESAIQRALPSVVIVPMPDAGDASAIAVGGGRVYWTDSDGGTVRRCTTTTDCAQETLIADPPGMTYPREILLDEQWLYWADGFGRVLRCEPDQCMLTVATLAIDQASPYGLAVYGGALYWTDVEAETVMRCADPASCLREGPMLLADQTGQWPTHLAVDATGAYWVNELSGALMRCRLPDCTGGPEELAVTVPGVGRIALGADSIYWAQNEANQVVRLAKPPP